MTRRSPTPRLVHRPGAALPAALGDGHDRGRSAFQSVGPSIRTVRTVTSSAAVLPPQTGQRRRQILAKGCALDEPAGWNRTGPLGGQRSVLTVPTGRPQG